MAPLLAAVLLLLQSASPPAPAVAPTHSFRDEGLHVTFTYPAGFTPVLPGPAQRSHELTLDNLLAEPSCETTPLFASRQVNATQLELLIVLKYDFGCLGKNAVPQVLGSIAGGVLQHSLARIGKPEFLKPVKFSLDKYEAVLLQGSAPDARDGIPGQAAAVCTLIVNTALCWEVVTAYPSHIAPLLASTVTFDKRPPNPLAPADLVVVPEGDDPK